MKRSVQFFLIFIIFLLHLGCGKSGLQSASYNNASVSTPIEYQNTDIDGGIAEEFLIYILMDDYRSAYALIDQKNQLYRSPYELKEDWKKVVNEDCVYFTGPGVIKDYIIEDMYLYCFPATIGNKRNAIIIWVKDEKIMRFLVNSDFELAEQMICALTSEDFENCKQLGEPQTIQLDWENILEQTGIYKSTNPPYLKSMGDSIVYRFPSKFENGEFFIDILIGYFPHPGAVVFEVCPVENG